MKHDFVPEAHRVVNQVAFTPKGGCPLKLLACERKIKKLLSSIHPQGWVPIETAVYLDAFTLGFHTGVAFTPKGGCPLKQGDDPAE